MAELNQIVEQLSTLTVLEAAELVKTIGREVGRLCCRPYGDGGHAWCWRRCR